MVNIKIAVICTGSIFTPSMLYKENYLIKAAVEEGHEVLVLSSIYIYDNGKVSKDTTKERYLDGYTIKRFEYKKCINTLVSNKVRNVPQLNQEILEFSPDLIYYNCPQIYNITQLRELKEKLPKTKIVLDFTTTHINSGLNFISMNVLHKIIYKAWIHKGLPYVDKIYYVVPEAKAFITECYGLREEDLEHRPLPGELIKKELKVCYRNEFLKEQGISEDHIVFSHSGKMDSLKKTVEMLEIFKETENSKFRLFIVGSFSDDIKERALEIIESDKRIKYLGFKESNELVKILAATDMYIQPGTVSHTAQATICAGTPIVMTKRPSNEFMFNGNGFFIDDVKQLTEIFNAISNTPEMLKEMSDKSYKMGMETLDYKVIFHKMIQLCEI